MSERPRCYKGRWIVKVFDSYRVKALPGDSYSLHHGSFETEKEAEEFIDRNFEKPIANKAQRQKVVDKKKKKDAFMVLK